MTRSRIEEAVDVVSLSSICDVCDAQVANEQEDEEEEVDPWLWIYPCEEEFEERECGVETVL